MKKQMLAIVLIAGVVWVGSGMGAPTPQKMSRQAAADFQLTDLDGNPLQLSAFRGKVVLLDFWATWCPPCRAEIPHFKKLYTAQKGNGLQVIGLSMGEDPKTVRSFISQNGVNYPIAISTSPVEAAYGGIRGIPTTFLIDKEGRIAQKFVGYQDPSVFEREIRVLLLE